MAILLMVLLCLNVGGRDCHAAAKPEFELPQVSGHSNIDGAAVTFTCPL